MNHKSIILSILVLALFSCESKVKSDATVSEIENSDNTIPESQAVVDKKTKYRDTIAIDYAKNEKLLEVLKMLPESTMASWEWSKADREKTVAYIKQHNFIIDSTEMYNNIKYIEPNTMGIQVVDGFWTLSIYPFSEDEYFVVTNDIVGDGNDIQTFNFKKNELTPTKMINWFSEFDSKLLANNTAACIALLEDNKLTFEYDFSDKNTIKIASWSLNKDEADSCLKGNAINYELNKVKRTFEITKIYWENNQTE